MNKKIKPTKKTTIMFAMFILGILISLYIKTLDPSRVYISLEEKKIIEKDILYTTEKIKKLKEQKLEYDKVLKSYKNVSSHSEKNIEDVMNDELVKLKKINGDLDVSGEGVTLTIKDSERDLEEGQNPNDLLVHDIDILRIVNDLKKSGASAISINDERVTTHSEIKCSGATITVNGTTYGQPFIIKAIGDVDVLKASIISPESYVNLLKDGYGIYVNVKESDNIKINYYKK